MIYTSTEHVQVNSLVFSKFVIKNNNNKKINKWEQYLSLRMACNQLTITSNGCKALSGKQWRERMKREREKIN